MGETPSAHGSIRCALAARTRSPSSWATILSRTSITPSMSLTVPAPCKAFMDECAAGVPSPPPLLAVLPRIAAGPTQVCRHRQADFLAFEPERIAIDDAVDVTVSDANDREPHGRPSPPAFRGLRNGVTLFCANFVSILFARSYEGMVSSGFTDNLAARPAKRCASAGRSRFRLPFGPLC